VVRERRYARQVIFVFAGQQFGIPVEYAQEITFFSAIDRMYGQSVEERDRPFSNSIEELYKHGDIDGSLLLRGRRIPVLRAGRLLAGGRPGHEDYFGEDTRVIVIRTPHFAFGLVVEQVNNIERIPEDAILPVEGGASVTGIFRKDGRDILLLDVDRLIYDHADELKALTRLSSGVEVAKPKEKEVLSAHHLITENCYLVFNIGRNMAVQLKDVQEIIERTGVLGLPGTDDYRSGIINLRGQVVPVVNLRAFYGFKGSESPAEAQKLVICRSESRLVAFEVDQIVTIYKQEQYQQATSVKKELARRKDTLDRLIVFAGEDRHNEHVFVVNVHNLVRNHLDIARKLKVSEETNY
jgi:purine-binding chemotaxis protein CheW